MPGNGAARRWSIFRFAEPSLQSVFQSDKAKAVSGKSFSCSAVAGPLRIFRLQIYKTIRRIATEVLIFLGVGDKDNPSEFSEGLSDGAVPVFSV